MTYGLAKCARKACGKPFTRKTWNQKYHSGICQRLFHDKPKGTMNFSKVLGSPPQQRILHLLKDGIAYTTREIQRRARVCNPATWISSLKMQGYVIECKYKGVNKKTGARIYTYQLKFNGRKFDVPNEDW